MISGFLEEGSVFSSWLAAPLLFSVSCPPSLLLFFLLERKGKINLIVLEIQRFPFPCNQEKEFSVACFLNN